MRHHSRSTAIVSLLLLFTLLLPAFPAPETTPFCVDAGCAQTRQLLKKICDYIVTEKSTFSHIYVGGYYMRTLVAAYDVFGDRRYLNTAIAYGSHSLESLVNEVARSIEDPESKVSVWKRLQARLIVQGSPQQRKEARNRPNLRIGALGSGSDFSPFLDHLGVASLDLSYAGEDDSAGVYHSIYDDFYWYTHFSDTDFAYGRALAQTAGTVVMRLAAADILPYDFSSLSDTVHQYSDEVKALLKTRQDEALERQSDIESNVYHVTSDPKHPTVAPPALETPPYLNFAPLDNALALLDKAAAHYNTARAKAEVGPLSKDQLKTINGQLAQAERKLTSPQGLPRRPWMRHLLYAPGCYTGYDPKTLPGVREAIEQRRYPEAETQIALAAQALTDEAAYIEQVAKELESTSILPPR